MTDYEKLKALLTEFGVGFTEEPHHKNPDIRIIECYSGNDKIEGYCSFFTHFEFDNDGAFIQMGAWEM